jgi:DNA-binding transcriptional LysR family regulator
MDLRQLHYFSVLAETLNFHRAAERLHISQPPLTVAIRKLEEELGAPLFVRSTRSMSLTPAGKAALEPAREALLHAEQVRKTVRQGLDGERGRLSIGFVGSATFDLLPRLIQPFRRAFPQVELILEEGTSVDICRHIDTGAFDIGLVRLPLIAQSRMVTHTLEHDRMVAAVPTSHPLARKQRIRIEEMAGLPFVLHGAISILRSTTIAACQNAGFVPHVAQEATQVQTILSLVQSGLGVALVPSRSRRFTPDGVVLVDLVQPTRVELGIAYMDRASAIVANFAQLALADS